VVLRRTWKHPPLILEFSRLHFSEVESQPVAYGGPGGE
jgi:hypothetical protein